MAATTGAAGTHDGTADRGREYTGTRESKPGFMTSEFISSMVAAIGILVAAAVADGFGAEEAWRLVAFLSIGYMISRGIAKSGVRHRDY